jgi:alkanesulfonate monooxygenase SsuD/methylene tetrahydromethanopterin reductase-like flavin-dependent oxidoreductase (luciferase family)
MIETWGFYFISPQKYAQVTQLAPEDIQRAYDHYLDLWVNCERWGFDGLAWPEHHFSIVMSPSPHLFVAAVAARTQRLRFTTMGSVLSLHDGRRFAEECGMLDYLTHGRYEPGIAPGAGPTEAIMVGIPEDQIRPRYYSGAEVLAKALAEPLVTHHDAFYHLEQVPITPRPRLHPGQSVWVTVMSPDSAAWCAERGYKMCTAWTPTPVAAALAARYREAAEAAGTSTSPSMLGIRRRVFVADSDTEAQEKYEASVDLIRALAEPPVNAPSAQEGKFETADPNILRMMMHPDDFAIGSPETVAEKLIEQCRAGGYGVVMAFPDFALFPHDDLIHSHELIGSRVAPILRAAEVGTAVSHE